jgi:predicted Fe-Mo cluster-binding NifX family protein
MVSSSNCIEKIEYLYVKNEFGHLPYYHIITINSKKIKDLSVIAQTVNILEENIGLNNDFMVMTLKA